MMQLNKLDSKIESYRDDIISTLQGLLKIKSVEQTSRPGMPFGPGVNEALEYILECGTKNGLNAKNVDGYAGHLELGKGPKMAASLCHLDVVPAGDGWDYEPFAGTVENGKIYGRGSVDNKGPAVIMLYVLKALKETNFSLNKKMRVIYGTNEESGWGGINYYLDKEQIPDMAFSPDANFPVIHAEKGILVFEVKKTFSAVSENKETGRLKIKKIQGGNAHNMVPDYCEAHLETNIADELKRNIERKIEESKFKLEIEKTDDKNLLLKSYGVSAHGSTPEEGTNAVSCLMVFLNSLITEKKINEIENFVQFYAQKIGLDDFGENINCYFEDDVSGKLKFNPGIIELNEKEVSLKINIRYPVTYSDSDILNRIEKEIAEFDLNLNVNLHYEPLYFQLDDPLIKTLNDVYNQVTGDDLTPIAIGGGTYARAIDNAAAFGPLFPGRKQLAHRKNEYIAIDDLIQAAKIYARAFAKMGSKEF